METKNAEQLQEALRFTGLSVQRDGLCILDAVNACAPLGSWTAIIGPNGAGKTTLVQTLLGNLPYEGSISFPYFGGHLPRIGYVPQKMNFDRGLPLTVNEFLAFGKQRRPLWFGVSKKWQKKAGEALARVEAEHLRERRLGALSGGELQRVLLALALLQDPELLILDEPEGGVDFQGRYIFCELLDALRHERGFTLLIVSHELATVTHHASHVICLNRRTVAEGPPNQTLTPAHLSATFSLHMGLVNERSMPGRLSACSAPCCRPAHEDQHHD